MRCGLGFGQRVTVDQFRLRSPYIRYTLAPRSYEVQAFEPTDKVTNVPFVNTPSVDLACGWLYCLSHTATDAFLLGVW